MESSLVTVYAAIPMPSIEFEEVHESRIALYDMLDELCMLSGQLDFDLDVYGVSKPTIELLEGDNQIKYLEKWSRSVGRCEVLKFSVKVPFHDDTRYFDIQELSTEPRMRTKEETSAINRFFIRTEFCHRISNLLVMANLSRVGSIGLWDSLVFQDGAWIGHAAGPPNMEALALQIAAELAQKIGWPKLKIIEFSEVWNWANKNKEFLDGFSGSPTGRALNAFSNLFEEGGKREEIWLVWSLVGIEALYVRGRAPVMEQVREKIQALLGTQDTHKKKIGKMYDFRSRFIHGNLDFPGLSFHAATEDYERYYRDQIETIRMAAAILAATLQEIIVRDWAELDFAYTVSNLE
jgi:hypothetical protein